MKNEWKQVALGNVAEINPARTLKKGMITPFIPMNALSAHTRSPARIDKRTFIGQGVKFQNGDTLLARITPCLENGKTVFVSGLPEMCVAHGSTEYIVMSGKTGIADSLFIYYLSRSNDFRNHAITHMEGTSGRQRVPNDVVEKYSLPLPPLPEQKTIARILGTLDDKIELNRRMNATLEAMACALFQSWFVDFAPVHAKAAGRQPSGMDAPTAPLFPASFQDSELGEMPEGWEIKSLDQVAQYLNGLALQKYPPNDGTTLPVIKIAQLRKGDSVDADRCDSNIPPEYVIDDGDVLFSWSGSLEVEIWCGGRGALNQHLFKVTSHDFPQWFYYHWTRQHLDNFRLIAASKATTMGHIQRKHLTEAKVLVPPMSLIKTLTPSIQPLLDKIVANRIQSRTLATLRNTLLPQFLSGTLQINH
ncbi:MAG: restriction endonuclease subunit S [Puniceicoccales bacterium]|jgi:type I restriction enzyme S subunit|nr:restriction endonuclease subunit S [Puniceicoccales bacterium]